ncbi:CBS domain-containing protein, partial [filamentous cyanobacterium LEGE 11480]
LQTIERSTWETKTLQDIAQLRTDIASVKEDTPMVDLIGVMDEKSLSKITVLSPAGAVAGVLDRGDILRAVSRQLGIEVSDEAVKQVKEAGEFPAGLQLGAIAQSIQGLK